MPDEAVALMPAAMPAEALYGAVWICLRRYLDPHGATYAVADAAASPASGSDAAARDRF